MNSKKLFRYALIGVGGYLVYKHFFAGSASAGGSGPSAPAPTPTFSMNPLDYLPGGAYYNQPAPSPQVFREGYGQGPLLNREY